MNSYKCKCGGDIIFEKKRTFIDPDTRLAICKKCNLQYEFIKGELKIKKLKKRKE